MKKISLILASVAILFASCAKEPVAVPQEEPQAVKEGFVPMTINVTIADTKADLGDDVKVNFEDGDFVAVFDGIAAAPNKFVVKEANGSSAVISGEVSEGAANFTAVYPMSAAKSFAEGVLTITVPAEQTIPAGKKVDPAALISVAQAAAGSDLAFRNAVSLVKFAFEGTDVKDLFFKGNEAEKIVGDATVDPATAVAVSAGSDTLVVKPAAAAFAAGTYYAAVLPTPMAKGFVLKASKPEAVAMRSAADSVCFERNAGLDLGNMDAVLYTVPNVIMTKEDLANFAQVAKLFTIDDVIKLGADIDLAGVKWTNPTFCGTFDGQNHRVYNLVTTNNTDLENVGFIGCLGNGTNTATLKNICVGSKDYDFSAKTGTYDGVSKITLACKTETETYKYPGLVAYAHVNSVVENVVNFAPVEVAEQAVLKHRAGGICGTMKAGVTVKDCINFGSVTANSSCNVANTAFGIGGISGCIDGAGCVITNCVNRGDIVSNGAYMTLMGGIAGIGAYAATVTECYNYGAITHNGNVTGACYTGGLLGQNKAAVAFTNCHNYGDITFNFTPENTVTGSFEVGGLTGYGNNVGAVYTNCTANCNITIGDCSATGVIEFGGLLGRNVTAVMTFDHCSFTGNITSGASTTEANGINIGGAVARTHQATKVLDCTVNATITNKGTSANTKVGGFIGYSQSTPSITNASFTGKVVANESTASTKSSYGGFCGWSNANVVPAAGCTIDATIEILSAAANANVGGLIGYMKCSKDGTIKDASAKAVITGAPAATSGVLVGTFDNASTKTLTVGAADNAIKVSGSLNGAAASADNLKGTDNTSAKLVINAAFE